VSRQHEVSHLQRKTICNRALILSIIKKIVILNILFHVVREAVIIHTEFLVSLYILYTLKNNSLLANCMSVYLTPNINISEVDSPTESHKSILMGYKLPK
jgi:hypothetical protein